MLAEELAEGGAEKTPDRRIICRIDRCRKADEWYDCASKMHLTAAGTFLRFVSSIEFGDGRFCLEIARRRC